jgi:hypothetical protein
MRNKQPSTAATAESSRVASLPVVSDVQVTIPPHAVSIEKAAEIVGVLPWTINEAIAVGNLPAKTAGRARTVRVADLIRWYDNLPDAPPRPSLLARRKDTAAA